MEIRGSLPIVEDLKLLSYLNILSEALLDVSLFLEILSLLKVAAQVNKWLLILLELLLALALVQSLFLLKFDAWLYLTGCRVRGDVEKVYIRLQVALLKEADALWLCGYLLFQLEVVRFLVEL